MNDSRWQAAVDEWIYTLAGDRHMHDVAYPGQQDRSRPLNCDFVLLRPDSDDPLRGLWIEFAGMAGAPSVIGDAYATRMLRKREIAGRHGLKLLVIRPSDLKQDADLVRRSVATLAPWLEVAALLESPPWQRLRRIPSSDAFAYAMQKCKYSDSDIIRALERRIEDFRRDPIENPLNIGACQKDPRIRAVYLACVRRSGAASAEHWAAWLVRAGLSREDAARVARIRQRHDRSAAGVLSELSLVYRGAMAAGAWPGREPALNGALQRRAIRAYGTVIAARAAAKRAVGNDCREC